MPKTTLAGHPLHPQLIGAPTSLMPMSLILDVMHRVTGRESYAEAAYYSMVGGYVGGLAAAAAGAGDYLSIPPASRTRRTANIHAVLNVAIMGLYSANLMVRRGRKPPTGTLPMLMNVAGNVGLLVSAWYGGDMVYTQGMRVKGVSPVANAPEIKLPGDEKIEEAFSRFTKSDQSGDQQG